MDEANGTAGTGGLPVRVDDGKGVSMEQGQVCPESMYGSNGSPNLIDDNKTQAAERNMAEQTTDDLEKGVNDEDGCCLKCCAPESRPAVAIFKIILCVVAGIIFGWCLEKSRVFEPASIRLQMVFKRWVMLKMFLAAVASGQFLLALMSVLPGIKNWFQGAMDAYGGCFADKSIITSALGPFILGAGMTLSGACPGMVLAQVGSWTKNSIYTLIGVLAGSLIYGLLAPFIIRLTRPKKQFEKLTLHELLKVPFIAMALPMSIVLAVVVALMEVYIPWENDLDCWNRNYLASPWSNNIFTHKSWYPSASGAVIGVLQIFIVMAVGDTLGGSSSYVTIVSQWVIGQKLQSTFPYLARARCGIGNWWQVFYVLGAVGGAAFAALASRSMATAQGVSIPSAVLGGILLLLGSRLAAGCTSGHGLSGMALLYWFSFIAVPAMFAGAIVVGFSMQATGALYDFQGHASFSPADGIHTPTWNCTNFHMP